MVGLVSGLEWVAGTETTHQLQSRGEGLLSGIEGRQVLQRLTFFRAKDGLGQRTRKGVSDSATHQLHRRWQS
jgi:hypothetical protein